MNTRFSIVAERRLEFLRNFPRDTVVTAAQLARQFGLSERTIYRRIEAARAEGLKIMGDAGIGYLWRQK